MPQRSRVNQIRLSPGRPSKYGRPSRAKTVTLPEDVITRLVAVDADLGRAIVRVAEQRTAPPRPHRPAELSSYGTHAVIIVTPINVLKRMAGVQLVPVGAGRALISLEPQHTISQFELDIRDALEAKGPSRRDRATLEAIADILRRTRRSHRVTLEPRTIIVLETKRRGAGRSV